MSRSNRPFLMTGPLSPPPPTHPRITYAPNGDLICNLGGETFAQGVVSRWQNTICIGIAVTVRVDQPNGMVVMEGKRINLSLGQFRRLVAAAPQIEREISHLEEEISHL